MYDTRIMTACTPDYAERAERLRRQGEQHGCPVEVVPYDPVGTLWLHSLRYRIKVFADELAKGRPCFWLDADAEMLRPFDAAFLCDLEARFDFAAPLVEEGAPRDRRYRAGVFWFAPTALDLAREWADICLGPEDGDDEGFLERLRKRDEARYRWGVLPDEYCWVPGLHAMPPPPGVVVLTHSAGQNPFSKDGKRRSGEWEPCSL